MSEFTSPWWDYGIAAATVAGMVACALLLFAMTRSRTPGAPGNAMQTTGHRWDEDLHEYNNPLPMWWVWLFATTIVLGLAYVVYYPGLGSYRGLGGWTSASEYAAEMQAADERYGALYARYQDEDFARVAADPAARAMGQRLFLNHCAQCHAADGRGSRGFPNLADGDWLYGGSPEALQASILDGRNGVMPPFGAVLGAEGTSDVAHYVLSLSGRVRDPIRAARGSDKYRAMCAACHGADGRGNPQIGAANLTDSVWLHGSGEPAIIESIARGRTSVMPAHRDFLGEAKSRLLAAYVYGLSRPASGPQR